MTHEQIKVLVETSERTFRGVVHKPIVDDTYRLSDHLNNYDKKFLCLSDVAINERGQEYRAGTQQEFVAIALSAITYITPIAD
ncbi:MAG: hypothetical protein U1E26_05425 [Coriobacteriia bacterium]|nr:hypothetical protein [Coriobacteriia bacterium]